MRWLKPTALALGLAAILAATPGRAEDLFFGVEVFAGTQYHDDEIWFVENHRDWREIQVRPLLGVHETDRWDLWVQANLGYIEWDDDPTAVNAGKLEHSIEAGVMGMTSYDVLKLGPWRLFGELGLGVGWLSETPDENLVGEGVIGFLEYGLGIKVRTAGGLIFKLGGKFHHRSCLTTVDAGVNSYGVALTMAKEL